jgi:predicted unusual protein kinase regulating ubiquinone biosynthesis (AarF/ABC1/UbiB family)
MHSLPKSSKLKRYREIIHLLIKYGRSDLVRRLERADYDHEVHEDHEAAEAQRLARDLERLGPTFVKLGQLLSTQADILPEGYQDTLDQLQDNVAPLPAEAMEQVIASELGKPAQELFGSFEATPIASASLAQVHRARLQDGSRVAIKIQRPDIREKILRDLDIFAEIAHVLDRTLTRHSTLKLSDQIPMLRETLLRELDYHQEATNLETLSTNLANLERILVPKPYRALSSRRVLTMEYIDSVKITRLPKDSCIPLDREKLVSDLLTAYLQQLLIDGMVHVDPHPGNVHVSRDGKLVLLDLGMVTYLSPEMQTNLIELLVATADGRGEDAAETALRLARKDEDFDAFSWRERVAHLVARYQNTTVGEIPIGRLVLHMNTIAQQSGVRPPTGFTVLGNTLLKLDRVVKILAPDYDANAFIRGQAPRVILERLSRNTPTGKLLTMFIEGAELVQALPKRVNNALALLENNEIRLKVDAIDEVRLISGIQKIANRITLGLVVAAMIVGAAFLMNIETAFTLFGYPGLAIILFLGATFFGIAQIVDILVSDERKSRKHRRH